MLIKNIFAILLGIVGIVLIVFAIREFAVDNSSKYDAIAGEVYDVRIQTEYIDRENLSIGNLSVRQTDTEYLLFNQYKFKLGDNFYTGEYQSIRVPTMNAAQAEKERIMKAKDKVTIYYLKSDPKQNGLTFNKNNSMAFFIFSIICFVLSVALFFGNPSFHSNNYNNNKVVLRTYNFD
jgi:hypothetical protein